MMKGVNRDIRTRALHETTMPIALDPAAMPGATVLGADGLLYSSIRYPTSVSPWAWRSAVGIAVDVTADAIRAVPPGTSYTVGAGGDFPTLNAALSALAAFYNATSGSPDLPATITILAGHVIAEQVFLYGVDLSWVKIVSQDARVPVSAAALTVASPFISTEYPIIACYQSRCPSLACEFEVDNSPRLNLVVGLELRGSTFLAPIGLAPVGFHGNVDTCFRSSGASQMRLANTRATGFRRHAFLATGLSNITLDITGGPYRSAEPGASVLLADSGGQILFQGLDARAVDGVDSATDVALGNLGGASIILTSPSVQCGLSQPANVPTRNGQISRSGAEAAVGTTLPQTLTNKTLTSPVLNGTVSGTGVSASQTDGSSATGRLARIGDFGLGAAVPPEVTDLTAAIFPGTYRINNLATAVGVPAGLTGQGTLISTRGSDGRGTFTLMLPVNTLGGQRVFHGSRNLPTGAITWQRTLLNIDILGTVVQAAGVPTGALFQGNAQVATPTGGWFERLADGFQIAHHSLTTSDSADTTWTFNTAFLAGSTPVICIQPVGDADLRVRLVSRSATAAVFSVRDGAGNRVAVPVDLLARGRWSNMT